MKTRIFVGAAALMLMGGSFGVVAPASWAQQARATEENPADWTTLRPSFASRLNHLEGVLKGKRTLRVTAFAPSSPHARFPVLGRNNKVAQIRLDNEPIDESFTNMPHEFSWNTRDYADGTHVLTIMLLDTVSRETETLDRVVVTLGNDRDDDGQIFNAARPEPAPFPEPLPAAPAPKRGGLASRGGASRDFDRGDFARLSPNSKTSNGSAPGKKLGDFGAASIVAPSASLIVEATKSDRPLMATATALCKANGMLYLGLKSGGIAACNPKTLTGWAVRPAASVSSAAPKALCADGNGNVYWLTSGSGKTPALTLYSWSAQTKKVASVVVTAPVNGANVTLSSAGKNVLVQTRAGRRVGETGAAYLVNPQTGDALSEETSYPFGVRESLVASGETSDVATRLDFGSRYSADQIAAIANANPKMESRWRQIGPDIVAQMDESGQGAWAYLPWNGAAKDGKITAALSDETGLWIATEKGGVRHITPGAPSDENGYDGYVRARLTDADEFIQDNGPSAERNEKIAAVVEEWQGTPYLWGGATKKGTDCSGFVGQVHQALGIKIPRSSDEMRASKQGERVHDELRYGDVLVYPGHVALYIGNGKTAETVGGTPTGSVSKSTIWRRREVAVRRYFQ